jgi:hypothetical protein
VRHPFSDADFAAIEARMAEVAARNDKVRSLLSRAKGLADYLLHLRAKFMKRPLYREAHQAREGISLYGQRRLLQPISVMARMSIPDRKYGHC